MKARKGLIQVSGLFLIILGLVTTGWADADYENQLGSEDTVLLAQEKPTLKIRPKGDQIRKLNPAKTKNIKCFPLSIKTASTLPHAPAHRGP